jgi:hypothetical protein
LALPLLALLIESTAISSMRAERPIFAGIFVE